MEEDKSVHPVPSANDGEPFAARMSVLSKQWHGTARIKFNESFSVEFDENEEAQRRVSIDFVNNFIADHPLLVVQKFSLVCSKPETFIPDMQNFVKFALSHNVKELEFDLSDPKWVENSSDFHSAVFELPLEFYQHELLESLKLFSCNFDITRMGNLGNLHSLSLGWMRLGHGFIKAVIENCPLLVNLSLKKCWNLNYLEITKPNSRLKSLVVDKCEFLKDWFAIDGPKLKYLKYSGRIGYFVMENQREMEEAELDFGMEEEFGEDGELYYELLSELYSVHTLTVCSVLLQIIPHGEEPLGLEAPLRVRHLIMKTAMSVREFVGMNFMLKSCPILEILTIDIGPAKIFPDYYPPFPCEWDKFWTTNLVVQHCIKRTLRVVNVKGFKGTLKEFHVLMYILHFGSVMEELNLYISNELDEDGGNRETYIAKAQILSKYPGASNKLIVSTF